MNSGIQVFELGEPERLGTTPSQHVELARNANPTTCLVLSVCQAGPRLAMWQSGADMRAKNANRRIAMAQAGSSCLPPRLGKGNPQ
jgi:hypothetical protein